MSRRDHCPRCGREKWRYLGTEPGPHLCFACMREVESSATPERAGARIAALEAAARAILPAAHAGIHFAFHEGNAVDEGTRYRAAYDTLKALLEVDA
jgi:hypothetical protein